MFSILWKTKIALIDIKRKYYILMGNKEKANQEYFKVLKMLDAFID